MVSGLQLDSEASDDKDQSAYEGTYYNDKDEGD